MESELSNQSSDSVQRDYEISKLKDKFSAEKRKMQINFENKLNELKQVFDDEREQLKAKIQKLQTQSKTLSKKLSKSKEKYKGDRQALIDKTNLKCEK